MPEPHGRLAEAVGCLRFVERPQALTAFKASSRIDTANQ
jgi:hypothetical protein